MKDTSTAFEPLMTTGEVAKALHVSPKTVSRWAKQGKLSATWTPGGGNRRFREADIRAILTGGRS